ncbi:MAG TPA: 3-deoxy-manno-octulosonate cytidylyltransferase [Flavobacterium sp.]|nr:3-deoxy-manno-octulosonate cytidylyltransferase [Flavobacterium sp.]
MKVIAVVPARYASTRFPAKLMHDLGGMTVIRRTYQAAVATGLFDDVFVVTDSDEIYNEITSHGGKAMMSVREHESGSDRIAEAVANIAADIVVNVQGDEPFMTREPLADLIEVFRRDPEQRIDLASLMIRMENPDDIANPNHVKVVTDQNGMALYFSRSVVPHAREKAVTSYFRHIGVYAFRRQALLDFATWAPTPLEQTEKLEQLRYLEMGRRIKMVQTSHAGIGIDTPEDLEKARALLNGLER